MASPPRPSLPQKVLAIHAALERARIPHALGGALALAYYAEPRATIDVDVNVFVATERWPDVRDALAPLGVDVAADAEELARHGQVRLWWERNPIDLFFSYDPLHDAMARGRRRVPFAEETLPILAPEHLLVCKVVFDRPKDWLDVEQILVAAGPLDLAEVDRWLPRLIGQDDPRLRRLAELRRGLALA